MVFQAERRTGGEAALVERSRSRIYVVAVEMVLQVKELAMKALRLSSTSGTCMKVEGKNQFRGVDL